MRQLNPTQRALRVHELGHAPHAHDLLLVLPQAGTVGGDAAARLDGRGFDENQGGAFESVVAEGGDMVGCQGARVRAGRGGAVLAHRGDDDSVAEGGAADGEWGEEGGNAVSLGVLRCAWRLGVLGCEEWEARDG